MGTRAWSLHSLGLLEPWEHIPASLFPCPSFYQCLFSVRRPAHSSVRIHPPIFPPAHPCVIPLSTSVIYISFIPLFLFFHSIYPSVYTHSSTRIHPAPHPPTYLSCSCASICAFTSAGQLLSLSICALWFVQIHPDSHSPPCYLSSYSVCHTLSIHVYHLSIHHPPTHPSFTHVIYLFLYPSIHTNAIAPARDYVIHFDKETATRGLICLPFSLSGYQVASSVLARDFS